MAVSFDGTALLITLDDTDLIVDVEADLYSEWKQWALLSDNSKFPPAFRTVGGDELTPGIEAGAYFFLNNEDGWRIKPDESDQTYQVIGNLAPENSSLPLTVPTDGGFTVLINGLQPITQSVETILTSQQKGIRDLQFMIESRREDHSGFGDIIYYDPLNGDDTNDGSSPALAVLTFAQAHTLATDHNNDIIFIINESAAQVVITERFNITKSSIHVRGSGADILVRPTDDVADAITISASGCSLESLSVETTASGTPRNSIFIDGPGGADNVEVSNITILDSTLNGILCTGGTLHRFSNMIIRDAGGDGINILDCIDTRVVNVQVERCTGWGFQVLSTDGVTRSEFVRFIKCMTHHNGPGGLNIGANSFMTIIDEDCYFAIASGNDLIVDGGVATHNDIDERNIFKTANQLLVIQQLVAGNALISPDNQTVTVFDESGLTVDPTNVIAKFTIAADGRTRTRTV